MTAPIDKAAEVLLADYRSEHEGGSVEEFHDLARAVFASIDTDELARALTASLNGRPWRDLTPRTITEAVKAHLLKEDS